MRAGRRWTTLNNSEHSISLIADSRATGYVAYEGSLRQTTRLVLGAVQFRHRSRVGQQCSRLGAQP